MDIADTLRQDIPKADFFEFVAVPETPVPPPHFPRIKEEILTETHNNNNSPAGENKETNNNHLIMNSVDMSNYDNTFWPGSDHSIMEELNTWAAEGSQGAKVENTDGAIYTLTVLNGSEQPVWYKQEPKEEKPTHSSLDIDSLLNNIIPTTFPPAFPQDVKSEYHFDDSGYVEKKDDMCNNIVTEIVLTNPGNFNNNNEWKEDNHNEVDSLLRNALQGKSFVRYNGIKTERVEVKKTEDDKMISIEAPMLYDSSTMIDSDNPSSHSMDDMFLSHLDVSYPEDYEKLKRIETEVAEYCLDRTYLQSSSQLPVEPMLSLATSTKSNKKYTKRSKSQLSAPGSSSGVRKERSLHYCNICNKGFKDKYSVNVHIRTHTGEKPFSCSLCGKSFRQKAHLAKHYQTHMAQAKNGVASTQKSTKNLIPTS